MILSQQPPYLLFYLLGVLVVLSLDPCPLLLQLNLDLGASVVALGSSVVVLGSFLALLGYSSAVELVQNYQRVLERVIKDTTVFNKLL